MDPDAPRRPMTYRCFECREEVPAGGMERHLRDAHRLSIYGEPLPMEWWKSVVALAVIVVGCGIFAGRC